MPPPGSSDQQGVAHSPVSQSVRHPGGVAGKGVFLLGDPQGVEGGGAGLGTSVTASRMTDTYEETVARRRSAALLSEFDLGHVREYAPFGLILSALHLILRAKSQHI